MGIIGRAYLGENIVYGTDFVPQSSDSDVQAFFDAVYGGGDTLTATEQAGVEAIVSQAKSTTLWNEAYAIYPLVGRTSTACKWNLKDTTQYNLTYSGTHTFDENGMTGVSVPAANTGIKTDIVYRMGVYIHNNIASTINDIGTISPSGDSFFVMSRSSTNDFGRISFGSSTAQTTSGAVTDSRGLFTGIQSGAGISQQYFYRNGSQLTSNTNTQNGNTSDNIYLLPYNGSGRTLSFAWIGKSNDTLLSEDYYTEIQAAMTTLGRNV